MKGPILDQFTRSYIMAALWSTTDETGEPLDRRFDSDDIASEAKCRMIRDCQRFQKENASALSDSGITDERAGFCFWLNRNGHGSGFWDESTIGVKDGEALSKASHAFGECDIYEGDDGKLYI